MLTLNDLVLEHLESSGVRAQVLQQIREDLSDNTQEAPKTLLSKILDYTTIGVLDVDVSTVSGCTFSLSVSGGTLVRELKREISKRVAIAPWQQEVALEGDILHDEYPLVSYGISPLRASISVVRALKTLCVIGGSADGVHDHLASFELFNTRSPQTEVFACQDGNPPMTAPRYAFAAAIVSNKLYAVGGSSNAGLSLRGVAEFDLVSGEWSTLPKMEERRRGLAVAACDGKLYVMGGSADGGRTALSSMEMFDPTTNSWTSMPAAPTSRYGHAAVVMDGNIFLLGGSSEGQSLASADVFDARLGLWLTSVDAPLPLMSSGRRGLAAVVLDDYVYAIGGSADNGGSSLSSVEAFDSASGTWVPVPSMSTPRRGLAAAADGSNIYACCGHSGTEVLASIEVFSLSAGAWTTFQAHGVKRVGAAAVMV